MSLALLLSLLPVLALTAAATDPEGNWSDSAAASFTVSDSNAKTIAIQNAAELALLAVNANNDNDYAEWTVTLDADLDLGAHYWTPIGYFLGAFDGQGHAISGLNVVTNADRAGLFGTVGSSGAVRNLTLKNANVSSRDGNNAGGIVGANFGTIEKCRVSGTVTSTKGAGGIAGSNNNTIGTISLCENNGVVKGLEGEGNNNNQFVGGITGENDGTVYGCRNTGAISNAAFIGGIVGDNSGTVESCCNTGIVSGTIFNPGSNGTNSYGGVYVADGGSLSVAGDAVVGLNYRSGTGGNEFSNIYLSDGCTIDVGALGNASFSLSAAYTGVFTTGASFADDAAAGTVFASDDEMAYTVVASGGQAALVPSCFTVTLSTGTGGSLTVTDNNSQAVSSGASVRRGTVLTINVQAAGGYAPSTLTVTPAGGTAVELDISGGNYTVKDNNTIAATFTASAPAPAPRARARARVRRAVQAGLSVPADL